MPYTAEISPTNPSCYIFLIDQSHSMVESIGRDDSGIKKADLTADTVNKLLRELVIRCTREGGVRDYFHVSVIGYGSHVRPAFAHALAGKEIVPLSEVANHPARVEERRKKIYDGAGGLVEQTIKFPVWLDAVADGNTPMNGAFTYAHRILNDWLTQHPNCFPPVLVSR